MSKQDKYITRGINHNVDILLQLYMWEMIEDIPVEKDYLQVFHVKPIKQDGKKRIQITMAQEVPRWEKGVMIKGYIKEPLKIFVIDDITHSTMMLAEEY